MDTESGFDTIATSLSGLTVEGMIGLDTDIVSLLKPRGGMPSSLAVEEKIRQMVNTPGLTIDMMAALIVQDPILALRLLGLANSSFYRRGTAACTISAAVNVLGLRKVADLEKQVSDSRNYAAIFLGRAVASTVLQELILAMHIARMMGDMVVKRSDRRETIALTAALYWLGVMTFAFHRPNVYSACVLDGFLDSRAGFESQFGKVLCRGPNSLAVAIAEALALPDEIKGVVRICEPSTFKRSMAAAESREIGVAASIVFHAAKLAREMCSFSGSASLDGVFKEAAQKTGVSKIALQNQLSGLPKLYREHCAALGVHSLRLPDYLARDVKKPGASVADASSQEEPVKEPGIAERMNSFLYELKACFRLRPAEGEFRRLPQAVLCTLQALVKGAGFSRACLLRYEPERDYIMPLFLIGQPNDNFKFLLRSGSAPEAAHMPDIQACRQMRAMFQGDPVFPDGWPFVAFPVVSGGRVEAVFYADKVESKEALPLETQEQVACIALAEGWMAMPEGFR